MLKGTQALMHAIETGTPEPTNEAQRKELSAEWQRTGSAETLAKLEAVEAKHTPGPWHVLDGAVLCEGINAYGNWHICRFDRCEQPNTAEDNANARLIAAAPELLEALKGFTQWITGAPEQYQKHFADRLIAARAAIARAEGGAK